MSLEYKMMIIAQSAAAVQGIWWYLGGAAIAFCFVASFEEPPVSGDGTD